MIDIEPDDDETFEDRLFEKADHIGDIVTGKKKYTYQDVVQIKIFAQHLLNKGKPHGGRLLGGGMAPPERKYKPNPFIIFINKYKAMPLSRLIGLGIILIFAAIAVATAAYLLFSIMMKLMNAGIFGIIGFGVLAFGLCMSTILVFSLRFNRK